MKQCVLIMGPESSGTKLLKQSFLRCGWDGGEGHKEKWSLGKLPEEDGARIVWRKSMPMGNKWWDVPETVNGIKEKGFDVVVFVTARDWASMLQSQKKKHSGSEANMRKAYAEIIGKLQEAGVKWRLASYEAHIQYGCRFIENLCALSDISHPDTAMAMGNANDKYYL